MTTLLEDLQKELHQGHTVDIEKISEHDKEWNKTTNLSCKHLFTIHIITDFHKWSMFPSDFAFEYSKKIDELLKNKYNGNLYCQGWREQGEDIHFDIMYRTTEVI